MSALPQKADIKRHLMFLNSPLRAKSRCRGALCSSISEQSRLRPNGRSVHGVCDSIPDFIACKIALISQRVSCFSGQFASCSAMTSL